MAVAYTLTDQLWELFYVDDDGRIQHSFYPGPMNTVGTETVVRGAKPGGQLQVVRQANAAGGAGRCDVYAEQEDGAFIHVFQNAPADYAWVEDGQRW